MKPSDIRHATQDTQCALPDGHDGDCRTYLTCVCGHYNTLHMVYNGPFIFDTRCYARSDGHYNDTCPCQSFRWNKE